MASEGITITRVDSVKFNSTFHCIRVPFSRLGAEAEAIKLAMPVKGLINHVAAGESKGACVLNTY